MGHEYDCDEPPNEVLPCVLGQAGYVVQADREVVNMGSHVALVAFQIEACARVERHDLGRASDQAVERIHEARDGVKVSGHGIQVRRPALRQHLAYTLPQLSLPLPALRHLLPEVLRVECEAIEQEPRCHVRAALRASASPYPQLKPAAACSAALEGNGRIRLIPARLASTPTLPLHYQAATTSSAFVAHEHDGVVELPRSAREAYNSFREPECQADDVNH